MKHATLHVLVAAITVVAALALEFLLKFVGKENLPFIAGIIITILFFSAALNAVLFRALAYPRLYAKIHQMQSELARLIDKGRILVLDRERRLFSTWIETEAIEERAREIWVLTLDFYWDLNNSKYSDLVKAKIKNDGAQYWWLYPEHLRGEAEDLKQRLQIPAQFAAQVCFTSISEDVAKYFPHDVVIYDPRDEEARVVLICDINGKKRDSPEESMDLPIRDPNLGTRYRRLFCELAAPNVPPWTQ